MSNQDESLYVVIPTHGRAELLGRTLDTLAACELPETLARVIVIENGSDQLSKTLVTSREAIPNLEYLHFEQANKSAALNHVLELLDDGLIVFFDDDVRVSPSTLSRYRRAAAEYPEQAFFGGECRVDYEREPESWIREYLPRSAVGWPLSPVESGFMPLEGFEYFIGFNWAARVQDLKQAGGFDPSRGPGAPTGSTGQETQMQRQLIAHGGRPVFVDDAVVWHYVPGERCSPRWALDRAWRTGVEKGMRFPKRGRGPWGVPMSVYKEITGNLWNACLSRTKAGRFEARRVIKRGLGFIHGFRLKNAPTAEK